MTEAFAPGVHLIDAYGGGKFNFAGMQRVGAILATPKGVRALEASSLDDLTETALAPLFADLAEAPKSIEFVVVGAGASLRRLQRPLADRLRAAGLGHEAMATGPAVRQYNVMLQEGRRVAAILLPAP